MPTQIIQWLHLSDFHTGKDNFGQEQLFSSILKFIQEKANGGCIPDFVFLTGDIANRGKSIEYQKFFDNFLVPLDSILAKQGIAKTFIVPGNHDVDRDKSNQADWHHILTRFPRLLDPTETALQDRQYLLERFNSFSAFDPSLTQGKWLSNPSGTFSHFTRINTVKIGILGINTAWLCQDNADEGKLTPGKGMVEKGLESIQDCDVKIVLGHHSIDWFRKEDKRSILSLFAKNQVIYLHGDQHENEVGLRWGGGFLFLDFQATASFQDRESPEYVNGFLWCELDLKRLV